MPGSGRILETVGKKDEAGREVLSIVLSIVLLSHEFPNQQQTFWPNPEMERAGFRCYER